MQHLVLVGGCQKKGMFSQRKGFSKDVVDYGLWTLDCSERLSVLKVTKGKKREVDKYEADGWQGEQGS